MGVPTVGRNDPCPCGSWALPSALGLTALGNFVNLYSLKNHKKMEIDTTNMCSHLRRKLFEEDGPYRKIWLALQGSDELTAVVRSRQLHIYRNGKKVLILAGKATPKVLREDSLEALIGSQTKQGISGMAFISGLSSRTGCMITQARHIGRHWKKIQPGTHRYERTDKDILR